MSTALTLSPSASTALDAPSPPWLDRALYPFRPKSFTTPEGTLRYLDEGSGPPVLLVHGTPSWSFEWRAQVKDLAKTHRVLAPDHLGFGLSDKPADASVLRPEDHARRLLALVDALDLRDLDLVVHDFGGPIGLPVALERPDRVRSVTVMNTWAWAHGDAPSIRRMSRLVASRFGRWLYLACNASPRWIVPMAFADRAKLTRAVHAHYLGPFARREDRASTWALGGSVLRPQPIEDESARESGGTSARSRGAFPPRIGWPNRGSGARPAVREPITARARRRRARAPGTSRRARSA